jgi:hypothetical protein
MSEVAGRLAAQVGANQLMSPNGGGGVLMGGVAGTAKAKVVVIGGGVAGEHAAANSLGMGAEVTVVDLSIPRLRQLEAQYTGLKTAVSTSYAIAQLVREADLVIGSVLIPGAAAPKLVTDAMVADMKPGSVLVDIAIDQGGCFEGSRPTHSRRPDLHGAQQHLLLRRQHAGRRLQDLDPGAHECDAAVRAADRRQGLDRRGARERAAVEGREHARRRVVQPRGGRSARVRVEAAGGAARVAGAGACVRRDRSGARVKGGELLLAPPRDRNMPPLAAQPAAQPMRAVGEAIRGRLLLPRGRDRDVPRIERAGPPRGAGSRHPHVLKAAGSRKQEAGSSATRKSSRPPRQGRRIAAPGPARPQRVAPEGSAAGRAA